MLKTFPCPCHIRNGEYALPIQEFAAEYENTIVKFNITFSAQIGDISRILDNVRFALNENQRRSSPRKCVWDSQEAATIARERKAASEFSKMLSRNYLCSIRAEVVELENGTVAFCNFTRRRVCKLQQSSQLRYSLSHLYKFLIKAMRVYAKFLRKSVVIFAFKLRELLSYVIRAQEVSKILLKNDSVPVNDISGDCQEILSLLGRKEITPDAIKTTITGADCPFTFTPSFHKAYLLLNKEKKGDFSGGNESAANVARACCLIERSCDAVLEGLMKEIASDMGKFAHKTILDLFENEITAW